MTLHGSGVCVVVCVVHSNGVCVVMCVVWWLRCIGVCEVVLVVGVWGGGWYGGGVCVGGVVVAWWCV